MATRSVVHGLRGLSLAISGVMVASLERPCWAAGRARSHPRVCRAADRAAALRPTAQIDALVSCLPRRAASAPPDFEDRKSTRLNSSHLGISYAVFCLK